MSWPFVKMDYIKADIRYAFVGGPFGSNLTSRDYVGDGVPVIRGQNLGGQGWFNESNFVYVSEDKAERLRPNMAFRGDLVFTQRGTLGQVALIPENSKYERYIVSQSQMKLTVNPDQADARFIYFYFRLPATIEQILNRTITAGVPHINLGILKDFEIPLPPIGAQVTIADFVQTYDDLIEINRRRIALLEESARLLYREWFVNLRFPGHELAKMVNGVPDGWRKAELLDLCHEIRDQVDPASVPQDTPYLSMEHMPQKSICLGEWEVSQKVTSAKIRFDISDVLFGKIRPYFHKVGVAQTAGITSTDVIVVRAKREPLLPLLVLTMSSEEFVAHAVITSNGTKMPRADWKVLQHWRVLLPDDAVLSKFSEISLPTIDALANLSKQNIQLRAARDALLPKLMSGEIQV